MKETDKCPVVEFSYTCLYVQWACRIKMIFMSPNAGVHAILSH